MLDPFSALSLASNIVQFVDFSSKLISNSREIYSSRTGSTAKHKELESLYLDLHQLSQKVNASSQSANGNTGRSPEEAALEKVAGLCMETADELLSTIRRLKSPTTGSYQKWRSFHQALKSIWNQERIDALRRKLDSISGQLNTHYAAILRCVR